MEPKGASSADSIHVVCRFRPIKPGENHDRETFSVNERGDSVNLFVDQWDSKQFTFDKILGMDCTQQTVFDEVEGVVDAVMSGFNGTVLAYGQTSAGKSWTMEGPDIGDHQFQGIIPRSIDRLFQSINKAFVHMQFQVSATSEPSIPAFFEIVTLFYAKLFEHNTISRNHATG
jgi:kinesin family protein 5